MNGLAGAKGFVLVGGRTTWWNLMNVFETRGTQPRDRKKHTFFFAIQRLHKECALGETQWDFVQVA